MKVKKEGTQISAVNHISLFKHCTGGFSTIHEKEWRGVEQVLLSHNVNYIKMLEEKDDGEKG